MQGYYFCCLLLYLALFLNHKLVFLDLNVEKYNQAMECNRDFKKQPVRIGLYDIEETIGKGNFAFVKLARHRMTKSRVSLI